MLTLSTINFFANGLVARLAEDSELASHSHVANLIGNKTIAWIGFLPIGWVSRWVDPMPAKAVEATYSQFLLDANRDGHFK